MRNSKGSLKSDLARHLLIVCVLSLPCKTAGLAAGATDEPMLNWQQRGMVDQLDASTYECFHDAATMMARSGSSIEEISAFSMRACSGAETKLLVSFGATMEQAKAHIIRIGSKAVLVALDQSSSRPLSTVIGPPREPVPPPTIPGAPAADTGSPEAEYLKGAEAFARHDYASAMDWYRGAANQGFAPAQNRVGYIYQMGLGIAQDFEAAMNWYRKAADQGYANSQYNIGTLYQSGAGVPMDTNEARRWYSLAAAQGYELAKAALQNLR
jgi:hypothetical protein